MQSKSTRPSQPMPGKHNFVFFVFLYLYLQSKSTRATQPLPKKVFWFTDDSAEIMNNRIMRCTPKAPDLPNPCQANKRSLLGISVYTEIVNNRHRN